MRYRHLSDHFSVHRGVLSPYAAPGAVLGARGIAGKKLVGPTFRELVFRKGARSPTARGRPWLSVAARHAVQETGRRESRDPAVPTCPSSRTRAQERVSPGGGGEEEVSRASSSGRTSEARSLATWLLGRAGLAGMALGPGEPPRPVAMASTGQPG